MSFVEQDDVLTVIESLSAEILRECHGIESALPFPRLTYDDAMLRYGSDKPDLRFGLEIVELSDWAAGTEFQVFKSAVAGGGKVRAITVPSAAEKFSRKQLDELTEFVKQYNAKGL